MRLYYHFSTCIRHQNWKLDKAVLLIFSYMLCHFLPCSSLLLLYTVKCRVLCSNATAALVILLPEPGVVLCFSHFMADPCLSRELDFPGLVSVWVNLAIPAQAPHLHEMWSPWEQLGFPLAATARQDSQLCSAGLLPMPGLISLDFLPRWQSCPASLARVVAVPSAGSRAAFPGRDATASGQLWLGRVFLEVSELYS